MCKLCDEGKPQDHSDSASSSRRDFLKASTATAAAAAGGSLFATPVAAHDGEGPPQESGRKGRRYLIRGGHVMSMDPAVGDFARADVLVEGKKILAVGPNLQARGAAVIDARGRIVMPGFIDTHHHQSRPRCAAFSPTDCCSTTASPTARSITSSTSWAASRRSTGPRTSTSTRCSAG